MKRNTWTTILLVFLFVAGLSLLLYPTFANYWNSTRQSRAIASYVETVDKVSAEEKERLWQEAVAYNEKLQQRSSYFTLPKELREEYTRTLDVTGTGIMGYVDIPSINVTLPIYHGTTERVLQTAIGHIDWTHLPVGGAGTHCAISGHRGLPSARLFTDLDELVTGDLFMLQILDRTLTYEVDQILIVEPSDVMPLAPEEGMDYCTLETCTPYGVNSHRLLVRGHRVENLKDAVRIVSEAMRIEPMIVAPVIGVPLLVLLVIWIMAYDRRRNRKRKQKRAIQAQIDESLGR